ncbi:MAG TPA: hypothetical protein VNT30_02380 [Stellaceae bacterium]|nr:hypothetical protein [Stellaceae bacterium]
MNAPSKLRKNLNIAITVVFVVAGAAGWLPQPDVAAGLMPAHPPSTFTARP